ncbi:MAG: tetratricopeptide repeat protein [Chlorobi bacterium]|nr:tetratricopeptide repeat protein [Chlorobiota bacterium]
MAKIFNLKEHSLSDQSEELRTAIQEMTDKLVSFQEGETGNIVDFLISFLDRHEDLFLLYAIINSQLQLLEEFDKAEQVLKEGIKRFPERFLLAEDLAILYTKQNRLAEAEKLLNDVEGLIPDDETIHKSDWLLNYGKLYWEKGEKKKAVERWVNAIETDPLNHFAIFYLALYLDNYKNLKSHSSFFNDIFTFVEIQKKKFFNEINDSDFIDEQEKEEILLQISNVFTEMYEIEKEKLSKMNAARKRKFFSEIEIDFFGDDEELEEDFYDEDDFEESFDEIEDSIFDAIPEEDHRLILFVAPLLNSAGIKKSRLSSLYELSASPSPIEKYLLQWGVEVVREIMYSYYSKNKKKKKESLDRAKTIATEIIENEEEAEEAISYVIKLIELLP